MRGFGDLDRAGLSARLGGGLRGLKTERFTRRRAAFMNDIACILAIFEPYIIRCMGR